MQGELESFRLYIMYKKLNRYIKNNILCPPYYKSRFPTKLPTLDF